MLPEIEQYFVFYCSSIFRSVSEKPKNRINGEYLAAVRPERVEGLAKSSAKVIPGEEETMRILLISHSYTDPGYWDKLDALGRRAELAAVPPQAWRGYLDPA